MLNPNLRFMQPPLLPQDEFEPDEHGNINWSLAWNKELESLRRVTEEQEKNGVDQEWFKMMLFKLRSGMMMPNEAIMGVPPPPPHAMPPNPGEVPQE